MRNVNDASATRSSMEISYTASPLVASPPNTFATMSLNLRFCCAYNRRICERGPIIHSVVSALGNWGLPVFFEQMVESRRYDLIVRKSPHVLSMIGDKDTYL